MMASGVKTFLGPMRIPFLILTPACLLVGLGTALWTGSPVDPFQFILVLIGGLAAHISVNALNEYYDFKSGLDFKTTRTPFSGGSGSLPAQPQAARQALLTGLTSLAITGLVGVYFTVIRGWGLLPLGIAGLVVVFAYTLWLVRNPILSLLAPGVGFGFFMVNGTQFALAGQYNWTAFIASFVPFFLVSDLLLLNQFPDVEADKTIGRKHFPILLGNRASSLIYSAFLAGAYLSILVGVVTTLLPVGCLLGLLTLPLAVRASLGAYRNANQLPGLIPSMGMNVLINILTPTLVAIGLIIG